MRGETNCTNESEPASIIPSSLRVWRGVKAADAAIAPLDFK